MAQGMLRGSSSLAPTQAVLKVGRMVLPLTQVRGATREGTVELQLSTRKDCSACSGRWVLVGAQAPKESLPAL